MRMLLHYLTPAACWVSRKTRNGFRLSERDILYQQDCGTGHDIVDRAIPIVCRTAAGESAKV